MYICNIIIMKGRIVYSIQYTYCTLYVVCNYIVIVIQILSFLAWGRKASYILYYTIVHIQYVTHAAAAQHVKIKLLKTRFWNWGPKTIGLNTWQDPNFLKFWYHINGNILSQINNRYFSQLCLNKSSSNMCESNKNILYFRTA